MSAGVFSFLKNISKYHMVDPSQNLKINKFKNSKWRQLYLFYLTVSQSNLSIYTLSNFALENTLYYSSKQFTHNTHCKSEITDVLRVYLFLLVHREFLDALETSKHQNKP